MDIVYSRDQDGNVPIHILGNGHFEIHEPDKTIICTSARQLLIKLTGHPSGRNWTFDRYFRQGIYTPPINLLEPITPIWEMFGIVADTGIVVPGQSKASHDITIHPGSLQSESKLKTFWSEQAAEDYKNIHTGPELGINLDKRGHEVAKLLFAGFKNWIFGSGYDPQDVLQEVYKGILIRNLGTCPFDERKASFGHYVHRVCQCVLSNYHRREARRGQSEMVGIRTLKDGTWQKTDAAEALAEKPTKDPRNRTTMMDDLTLVLTAKMTRENRLALRVLPLMGQGYTHADISEMLEISRTAVGKAMVTIRDAAHVCGYLSPSEDKERRQRILLEKAILERVESEPSATPTGIVSGILESNPEMDEAVLQRTMCRLIDQNRLSLSDDLTLEIR